MSDKYVLHWYYDLASSGVLPMLFSEDVIDIINPVLEVVQEDVKYEWVKVEGARVHDWSEDNKGSDLCRLRDELANERASSGQVIGEKQNENDEIRQHLDIVKRVCSEKDHEIVYLRSVLQSIAKCAHGGTHSKSALAAIAQHALEASHV